MTVKSIISIEKTVEVVWNLQKSPNRKDHLPYAYLGIAHSVGVAKNSWNSPLQAIQLLAA